MLSCMRGSAVQVLLITAIGFAWIVYIVTSQIPTFIWPRDTSTLQNTDVMAYRKRTFINGRHFAEADLIRDFYLDERGQDVLVNVLIQKTSSSCFNSHLWYDLDFDNTCTCREKNCGCLKRIRNRVLFSSEEDSWPCGLHPDWTHLQDCMRGKMDQRLGKNSNRRFLYVTMVRDPVDRFVSEWLHTRRGAGWEKNPRVCKDRAATEEDLPSCYKNVLKENISLEEFYSCSSSLAINRQTRMLANLSVVNCNNTSGMTNEERHIKLLKSAKENLKNMAFFGLTEYQILSQVLFERTFHLKFITNFRNKNSLRASRVGLSPGVREKIIEVNKYDILLYQFAKDLFLQRLDKIK